MTLFAILALTAALQTSEVPAEPLGWTRAPVPPVRGQETELDRLSRSPSGAGLSTTLYGSTAEDERVAIDVTLRALDKITARFTDLTVPIGEAVEFGSLTLLPRTCSTRPPEEFPETSVFLEVYAGDSDVAGQRARVDDSTAADDETPLVVDHERHRGESSRADRVQSPPAEAGAVVRLIPSQERTKP